MGRVGVIHQQRRIDQLLSTLGYCSRKDARAWCTAGRVTVDGEVVSDAASRVEPDSILVDREPLDFPNGVFIMLHKPVGYVCSHDSREGHSVYRLLPERWSRRDPQVNSVGRLDKDTSGLLLLTDCGPLIQRLTSPKHHVDKVYIAQFEGRCDDAVIRAFSEGVRLDNEAESTLPAKLELEGPQRARITLREGKYHQVRRMFAALGLHVVTLSRIAFGPWALGDLPPGEWKALMDLEELSTRDAYARQPVPPALVDARSWGDWSPPLRKKGQRKKNP